MAPGPCVGAVRGAFCVRLLLCARVYVFVFLCMRVCARVCVCAAERTYYQKPSIYRLHVNSSELQHVEAAARSELP